MKKLMKMKQWFLSAGLIFSACGCTAPPSLTTGTQSSANEGLYASLPFRMDKVAQPVFPDYSRSIDEFGAKADGITLNTEAINRAIRDVSEKGGGKVIVPSGLWLSGPIEILSNVNLHLEKNAILYFTADHTLYPIIKTSFEGLETRRCQSPVSARNAENIAITGYGVIDGNGDTWRPVKKGKMTASQWKKLVASGGTLNKKGDIWYPSEGSLKGAEACTSFNVPEGIETEEEWNSIRDWLRPVLVSFVKCRKVLLEGVTFKNSPSWCLHPLSCEDITVERICVSNPWYSQNGDALDLESCNRVLVTNCLFDAGDDGICLKSYYPGHANDSIYIADCRICTSASAVKFGTASHGGFRNVTIDNIEVYDTFRSAIAIETVDGGGLENVRVTRIQARNTGNPLFIRLGHRAGEKPGYLRNLYIGQMKVEVPFGRPDEEYDLRGPAVSTFHNPIPSSVTGIPGAKVENVVIEDVEIRYPGRATKGMAYVPLWRLDAVPEAVKEYPEFSMFGELPSWGFYVRHAKGITFRNVTLRLASGDFRPAFVLDDVEDATFEGLRLPSPEERIAVRDVKGLQVPEGIEVIPGE